MPRRRFTEPSDRPVGLHAVRILVARGVPQDAADVLGAILEDQRTTGGAKYDSREFDNAEYFLGDLAVAIESKFKSHRRELALLLAAGLISNHWISQSARMTATGTHSEESTTARESMDGWDAEVLRRVVAGFPKLDWNLAFTDPSYPGYPHNLICDLVNEKIVDPWKWLNLPLLRTATPWKPRLTPIREMDRSGPSQITQWVRVGGSGVLEAYLAGLRAEPDETIGRLAGHVLEALTRTSWPNIENSVSPPASVVVAFAAALGTELRRRHVGAPENIELLAASLLALRTQGGLLTYEQPGTDGAVAPPTPPPSVEVRDELVAHGHKLLAKLRPVIRAAKGNADAAEKFDSESEVYSEILYALVVFDGVWSALKQLLLLFRELKEPAVGPDLRYWQERDTKLFADPPPVWSWIPRTMVEIIQTFTYLERKQDEDLTKLRSEMGQFCLDRLKTSKPSKKGADKPEGPVEKDETWRYGYIRAFRELEINPGGDGHHVLFHASEHDEDDSVRAAARAAYEHVLKGVGLRGRSARRALVDATWWLRQAHMIALDQEVDEEGANRTRQKEARHTLS